MCSVELTPYRNRAPARLDICLQRDLPSLATVRNRGPVAVGLQSGSSKKISSRPCEQYETKTDVGVLAVSVEG